HQGIAAIGQVLDDGLLLAAEGVVAEHPAQQRGGVVAWKGGDVGVVVELLLHAQRIPAGDGAVARKMAASFGATTQLGMVYCPDAGAGRPGLPLPSGPPPRADSSIGVSVTRPRFLQEPAQYPNVGGCPCRRATL